MATDLNEEALEFRFRGVEAEQAPKETAEERQELDAVINKYDLTRPDLNVDYRFYSDLAFAFMAEEEVKAGDDDAELDDEDQELLEMYRGLVEKFRKPSKPTPDCPEFVFLTTTGSCARRLIQVIQSAENHLVDGLTERMKTNNRWISMRALTSRAAFIVRNAVRAILASGLGTGPVVLIDLLFTVFLDQTPPTLQQIEFFKEYEHLSAALLGMIPGIPLFLLGYWLIGKLNKRSDEALLKEHDKLDAELRKECLDLINEAVRDLDSRMYQAWLDMHGMRSRGRAVSGFRLQGVVKSIVVSFDAPTLTFAPKPEKTEKKAA